MPTIIDRLCATIQRRRAAISAMALAGAALATGQVMYANSSYALDPPVASPSGPAASAVPASRPTNLQSGTTAVPGQTFPGVASQRTNQGAGVRASAGRAVPSGSRAVPSGVQAKAPRQSVRGNIAYPTSSSGYAPLQSWTAPRQNVTAYAQRQAYAQGVPRQQNLSNSRINAAGIPSSYQSSGSRAIGYAAQAPLQSVQTNYIAGWPLGSRSGVEVSDPAAYRRLENDVRSLAGKVRESEGDAQHEQLTARLRALLAEQFDLRHEAQLKHLEKIQKQAAKAEMTLRDRGESKDEIVARRSQQLLGQSNPMGWEYSPALAPNSVAAGQTLGSRLPPMRSGTSNSGLANRFPITSQPTFSQPPVASPPMLNRPAAALPPSVPQPRRTLSQAPGSPRPPALDPNAVRANPSPYAPSRTAPNPAVRLPGSSSPTDDLIGIAHAAVLAKLDLQEIKRLSKIGAVSSSDLRRAEFKASEYEARLSANRSELHAKIQRAEIELNAAQQTIAISDRAETRYIPGSPEFHQVRIASQQAQNKLKIQESNFAELQRQLDWLEKFEQEHRPEPQQEETAGENEELESAEAAEESAESERTQEL